jgi:hypothetical protein
MPLVTFLRPRPKIRISKKLPERLVEFLRDVHSRIEAGDESTKIQSDDLLQCQHTYGGLTRAGSDKYYFCHFPTSENEPTWGFALSAEQIGQIAYGELLELEFWGCQSDTCQELSDSPDHHCGTCDWVRDEDAAEYSKEEIEQGEALRLASLDEMQKRLCEQLEAEAAAGSRVRRMLDRFKTSDG